MTCIIGAKGKDGVILVSDRLIVRGNEVFYEDKIHILWRENPIVAVAFAGLTGIRDKFNEYAIIGMMEARVRNLTEVVHGFEDIAQGLYERYGPRIARRGETIMEAVIAGLASLYEGRAELYHLFQDGYAEEEHRFCCIGSAGPFATAFLKLVYKEGMSLEELLPICGLIIRLIEGMGIDRNVGGGLDAVMIKDEEGIKEVPKEDIEGLLKKTEKENLFLKFSEVFKKLVDEMMR